ncbi:single-stranded DNA-binding protein [Streptosporangium saharense]|uniref:Single-stranded DNA-binding protein n=1 Tax=Streptosporangium saharense TaxID=1706840 RepID=A0A7W7VRL4_9ACTN|nr:single-stranded DNA-binding protein [Streptosporangium saharense]MBB4920221.1 single-strand DNA-binding protein [Streptosporangium saharense]
MNDIHITLTGNVAAPPRQHTFPDGSRVTSLRVASTSRYFDRDSQQWCNGETTYFGIRCFRGLADNVAQSIRAGQPVVVQGRLRIREFTHEGERRFLPEVEASSLGHDLRWGLGSFSKPQRGGAAPTLGRQERYELDKETHDWAMGGGTAPVPTAEEGPGSLTLVRGGADEDETPELSEGSAAPGASRDSGGGTASRTGGARRGRAARDTGRAAGTAREPDETEAEDETPWPVQAHPAA